MKALFFVLSTFRRPLLLGIVFVLYLFLGFSIVHDFGLSWDEVLVSNHGHYIWNALLDHGPSLYSHDSPYHGYFIPMLFSALDRWFGFSDFRPLYQFKHLLTFLMYSVGVVYFYRYSRRVFCSEQVACALTLCLVCMPRLFGHSFFNPKDIPFLALFIVSFYYLKDVLQTPNWKTVGLFSFFSALAINIRILGIMLWGLYGLGLLLRRESFKTIVMMSIGVIGLSYGCLYIMWPILWDNPLNLFYSFLHLSTYPWEGDVLFLGKFVSSHQLPWYYLLVWIAITTPLPYLFGIVFGIGVSFFRYVVPIAYRFSMPTVDWVLILTWVFLPLCMVIGMHSTLYDGWRHMYFIFPGLLLLSGFALELFFHAGSLKPGYRWLVFLGCIIIPITVTMYRLHPYEHLYFNKISGDSSSIRQRFETDYWGTSYFELYRAILKQDLSPSIRIAVSSYPGYATLVLLPKHERDRIRLVKDPVQADYFLTHFRWHPDEYPFGRPIYTVEREGITIATAYKMN